MENECKLMRQMELNISIGFSKNLNQKMEKLMQKFQAYQSKVTAD